MPQEQVVPRPAASVLLVRDHPDPAFGRSPLQVFLQRRVAGMAFAGGMTVFPGGGVDPADVPDPELWTGPDPGWWADRLGCPAELAGALVSAAVRETFEECGVLLAGPRRAAGAPPDPTLLATARGELVARRCTLAHLLAAHDLVLRADLLRPWSRWITPEAQPRRYDTAFFLAGLPEGQQADAHTTEAVEAAWWYPDRALVGGQRGELQLMAPTAQNLRELAEHPDRTAVLTAAAGRRVQPVTPRLVNRDGRLVVVLPGEPDVELPEPAGRP